MFFLLRKCICPFFNFEDLAFLQLIMAKYGLLNFSGPGNPVSLRDNANQLKVVRAAVSHSLSLTHTHTHTL